MNFKINNKFGLEVTSQWELSAVSLTLLQNKMVETWIDIPVHLVPQVIAALKLCMIEVKQIDLEHEKYIKETYGNKN